LRPSGILSSISHNVLAQSIPSDIDNQLFEFLAFNQWESVRQRMRDQGGDRV